MENRHYINVPVNDRGKNAVLTGLEAFVDDDFVSLCITDAQYDDVYWLFSIINRRLGLMIATAEDELLPAERVSEAMGIVEEYERTHADSKREVAAQILQLLRRAAVSHMPVDFSF